jgi:hypothetical protein
MTKDKTLEQIRREGLAALKEHLGVAGMVRFLQQFENGSGDYATERRDWVDETSLEDIQQIAESNRKGRKGRKALKIK